MKHTHSFYGNLTLIRSLITLSVTFSVLIFNTGCSNDNQAVSTQTPEREQQANITSSKGSARIQSCADDIYSSYIQLDATWYEVVSRNKIFSSTLFATIHGGGIEPGTTEVADQCASTNYDFYTFSGIKSSGNQVLHICSDNFDEPIGIARINAASKAIVLHGAENPASGNTKIAWVGGLDADLRNKVIAKLQEQGFDARIPNANSGLAGTSVTNYTNKTSTGSGCQIEMTKDLRKSFFVNGLLTKEGRKHTTDEFSKFVTALRLAVTQDKI